MQFTFKITSKPAAVPPIPRVNAFQVMNHVRDTLVSLPPRLMEHNMMYANHHAYNQLHDFLEKYELGWTADSTLTDGKRFVEGMSKAFFQCTPFTWKALNDKHNSGAFYYFCHFDAYECNSVPFSPMCFYFYMCFFLSCIPLRRRRSSSRHDITTVLQNSRHIKQERRFQARQHRGRHQEH